MASNYASLAMGATIVDVTHSDITATSNARNLLLDQDGLVWMAGSAPQHITLRLDDTHPPIQYVGWHVWQDYVTNPKEVEVSSAWGLDGEASGIASPLSTVVKMCVAQPGAGTQVWQLDTPIPSGHRYVRFSILSTFGPGPTYMNRLFLYDRHPGDGYQDPAATNTTTSTNNRTGSVTTPTHNNYTPTSNFQAHHQGNSKNLPSAASASSVNNSSITITRGGGDRTPSNIGRADASLLQSPVLHRSSSAPDMSYYHNNRQHLSVASSQGRGASTRQGGYDSNPYSTAGDNNNNALSNNTIHYGGGNNNSQYSVGRAPPSGGGHSGSRRGDSTNRSASTQMTDLLQGLDEDIKMLHPIRTISPSKGRRSLSGPHYNGNNHLAIGQYPSTLHGALDDLEVMSRPPPRPLRSPPRMQSPDRRGVGGGYSTMVSEVQDTMALQGALSRIDALERAVGGLTHSVDAQSRDLRDIRDLLMNLQRPAPPPPQAAPEPPILPSASSSSNKPNTQLIEFPEAALRGYIEDVLAPRLSKHAKRVEAKTLQRMDSHLQILLKEIGAVVDERVDGHMYRIAQQQQHRDAPLPLPLPPRPSSSSPPSYSDPFNARNRSHISPTRYGGGGGRYGGAEGLINSRLGTPAYSVLPAEDIVPRRPSIHHGSSMGGGDGVGYRSFDDDDGDEDEYYRSEQHHRRHHHRSQKDSSSSRHPQQPSTSSRGY